MTRILICAGDITLGSLLAVVVERMGHETEQLHSAPQDLPPAGDLLLVDPTVSHATAWAQTLRRYDPAIPIVSVGFDPFDRDSLGVPPTVVIPKPFALDELRNAVALSLRQH